PTLYYPAAVPSLTPAPPPSSGAQPSVPGSEVPLAPFPAPRPLSSPSLPLLHFPVPDIISTRTNPQRKTPSSGKRFFFRFPLSPGQMNRRRLGRRLCARPDTRLD